MSNYIKIPLASNPARSFRSTSITIAGSRLSGGGTIVAGTASAAADTTVAPVGGSGATFTMASSGTAIADVTLTCAAIGEGYKVGDVITVAIIPAADGKGSASAVMTFTVTAADLAVSSGSATNEYAMIPVDNVACIHEDSATSVIIQLKKIVAGGSGTGDGPVMQYAITMDDVPAISKEQLWADVSAAVAKAAGAENSQPEVKFTNDAECLSVVLS
tara:strand:+ start:220 stop:870 length:651 start_codon:yes stop_codon:yes gene_type:complete